MKIHLLATSLIALCASVHAKDQVSDSAKINAQESRLIIEDIRPYAITKFNFKVGRKVWVAKAGDSTGTVILNKAKIIKIENHVVSFQTLGNPAKEFSYADSTIRYFEFSSGGRATLAVLANTTLIGVGIAGCVLTVGLVVTQVALIVIYPIILIFSRGSASAANLSLNFSWVPGAFKLFTSFFKMKVPLKKSFTFPNRNWVIRTV